MIPLENFKKILKNHPVATLILNPHRDYCIIDANDAFIKAIHKPLPDLLDKPLFQVFPDLEVENDRSADNRSIKTALDKVKETKTDYIFGPIRYEIQTPKRTRQAKYLETHSSAVLDSKGELEYIVHAIIDITSQVLNKNELEQGLGENQQVAEPENRTKVEIELESNLQTIFNNSVEGFVLTDTNLKIKAFNNKASEYILLKDSPLKFEKGNSLLDHIEDPWKEYFKKQVDHVLKDNVAQYQKPLFMEGKGFRCFSFSIYPIKEDGVITGVCVSGRDITQQKLAEERLEKSEKKFRGLIENSSDGIMLMGEDNIVNYVSPQVDKIMGLNWEILLDSVFVSHFDSKNANHLNQLLDRLKQKPGSQLKNVLIPLVQENGTARWLEFTFSNKLNNEALAAIVVNFRDVTIRKQSELELFKLNSRLISAQKIASLGYWEYDVLKEELYWSDEHYAIWGWPKAFSVSFDNFLDSVYPEDRERLVKYHKETLAGKHQVDIVYRIIRADGRLRYVHALANSTQNGLGEVVSLEGTVQDITERAESEQRLIESNERFKLATRATSDAIWDYDLLHDRIFLGEGFATLFGHEEAGTEVSSAWITAHIHHDDLEEVWTGIGTTLADLEADHWHDEYLFRKAGGEYAIIINDAVILRDASGKPVRMIGAMKDVTALKIEEHRLRLFESVITNTTDAVLITSPEVVVDGDLSIIYANPAFYKMTGFAKEEILGKRTSIITGPDTDPSKLEKLGAAIAEGESCSVETVFYKRNGESYWGSLGMAPVRDETGVVKNYIAICRDITSSVNYIKEIEEQNKKLMDIAWVQSHLVRAPLSRILGLVNLITMDPKRETIDELLPLLFQSALDLDEVIKEIVRKTQNLT
ncbi:PAS domain S-box protein [Desertivirga brevis]|uniref:PAS domain S-box protein n=1 Tax=Desertivirga brevis TaxID=2810310 RepID=UPI001A976F0A|nr:PAS domain S-box protein [Pedobacter sp. SYSU D00873]